MLHHTGVSGPQIAERPFLALHKSLNSTRILRHIQNAPYLKPKAFSGLHQIFAKLETIICLSLFIWPLSVMQQVWIELFWYGCSRSFANFRYSFVISSPQPDKKRCICPSRTRVVPRVLNDGAKRARFCDALTM